jgi:acyl homoserine lactone synthase
MLRYLYADSLERFPRLAESMFRDRAKQFSTRLGWEVNVDAQGFERDEYDALNPLYVIWELPDGRHGGSMRFLPTTGPAMVNDHFRALLGDGTAESPLIWECTRFCLSPDADRREQGRASAALALGAGELMAHFQLRHYVGVFDLRMERIYRLMGLEPEVIGRAGEGREALGVGLWSMHEEAFAPTLKRVGVSRAVSRGWLRYALAGAPSAPSGELRMLA